MAYIIKPNSPAKVTSLLLNMTPYQVYLKQIEGAIDSLRASAVGMAYTPPQMGGYLGQREVVQNKITLQNIDFEVSDGGNS